MLIKPAKIHDTSAVAITGLPGFRTSAWPIADKPSDTLR